ncbi:ribonuclease III [Gemmiger formicilis]|nr:ribonuclease III [Gemmiger formicilis]
MSGPRHKNTARKRAIEIRLRAGHARPLRTSRKGERIWLTNLRTAGGPALYIQNPALLRIALTHTSYANESKVATTHNERLEFLGDSVLSVVVADYLFHQSGRPEGELTRMRASLVSEDALFQFAQEIQLGEYLRLGHGEDLGGGRSRPSVVSDAFEAVIAALYLDGGMEAARNFILPFITEGKTAEDDYKTRLQEVVQQDPSAVLKYEVTGETGPDHNKQFTVCVWRNGELLAEGRGRSKKPPNSTQQRWRWKSCNK